VINGTVRLQKHVVMTIRFDRPIGAPADLKELEYISALHQTCFPLRRDGSIDGEQEKSSRIRKEVRAPPLVLCPFLTKSCSLYTATDVVNYLSSRHGIVVDEETVKQNILVELSGELELEPAYKLDLVELVALLLIPYLLQEDNMRAIKQVLEVMLNETLSPKLNREFLKTLLDFHGEIQVSERVLDSMIDAAGGEGTVLNVDSLKYALTSDVMKYGVDWDEQLTTHYEDVFSEPPPNGIVKGSMRTERDNSSRSDEEDPSKRKGEELPFKTVWTAPAIDFTADTYRSQSFSVLLWVCLVMVYLAYFWNFELDWGKVDCSHLTTAGCSIINGITTWLVIFIELR